MGGAVSSLAGSVTVAVGVGRVVGRVVVLGFWVGVGCSAVGEVVPSASCCVAVASSLTREPDRLVR